MKKFAIALFVALTIATATKAIAECECRCVNGEVKAICSSTLDIEPICSPRICPIVTPAIKPIPAPTIPPIGTNKCDLKQVYNEYTHRYEWKNVCEKSY